MRDSLIRGCLCGALFAALSGCSIFSVAPTWELVKATGSATSAALNYGPGKATNTIHHGDAPIQSVCIEYNGQPQLDDLVPALQLELKAQGVSSRVYETGAGGPDCRYWVRYAATVQWAVPPMGGAHRSYLSAATLSLHRANGALMGASSYRVDENFAVSKWASTRRKLAPVVKAVITGFES